MSALMCRSKQLQSASLIMRARLFGAHMPTDAAIMADTIRLRAPNAVRIGLETGQMSNWLTLSLQRRGLPVICLDARHAKRRSKCRSTKPTPMTLGIGSGRSHRLVPRSRRQKHGRSQAAHAFGRAFATRRTTPVARQHHSRPDENLRPRHYTRLRRRVRRARSRGGEGNNALMAIVEPLLAAWQSLREQIAVFDRQISARAKSDSIARRLMTVPASALSSLSPIQP